jgi:outer membrane protein OmpA-like peptidoglycan-associated protein
MDDITFVKKAKVKKLLVYIFLFFNAANFQAEGISQPRLSFGGERKNISDEELELMTEASNIIEFYEDTYVLTLESIDAINKIAKLLEENKDYKLVISSHYFESKNRKRNLKLSLQQAEAIKTYFMFVKLDEERIKVNGFGDRIPLSITDLSRNTRIDLSINY